MPGSGEGAGLNDFIQNDETVPVVDSPNQEVQNDETVPTANISPDQMSLGTGSMGIKGIDLFFLTNELGKTATVTLDQNFQA